MLIIVIWLFACIVYANPLEVPRLQGYVSDYASMISAETKTRIEGELRALEQSDSTQIFILTVPSLEGEVLEEFAIKVFDAWKAGQKKLDNGVIVIVAQKERKIRIEVGRGLEGKLTDLDAGKIIDLVMKPKFKEGDFNGGFLDGVSSLIQATKGEFKTGSQNSGSDGKTAIDFKLPMVFEILGMVAQKAENFMEFVAAASVLFCALPILRGLKLIKKRKLSIAIGAAALPVIAFFTIWDPGSVSLFTGRSLFALLFYIIVGGVSGALVSFVTATSSGAGSGSSGSSSRDWSSGSSSGGSSSSGGGGGSSGGGGASGDY